MDQILWAVNLSHFCKKKKGIKHITSAPYHPSTNGLVQRAVQTFKQGMKKQADGSVDTELARYLLSYRITPQSTTGESPAQLRWGRSLRSHLDLLRPDLATRVHLAQSTKRNSMISIAEHAEWSLLMPWVSESTPGDRSGSLELSSRKPVLCPRELN